MRIAHIITRMILGGAQENTLLSCEDLLRIHGEEVLLLTGPALGPEGSLMERARAGGIPIAIVPALRREIHPLRDPASYWELKRALKAFRPDVVHTHSGKAGLLGRLAASALRVPAIVHTVHGAPFHPYQRRAARALFIACERLAARHCDRLVSVADAMTRLMVEARVAKPEQFVTIYSGMEVEPFLSSAHLRVPTRRELGYSDDAIVIVKVARLFHLKGHDHLIRAAAQVVSRQPRVRFLLVGDGILAGALRQQIREAGLDTYFQFTGLVPPERIPALLAAGDMVVHTSLREGLARVLPQALLSGKPVISYDIDGAGEVVRNDATGILLPPKAIEELAAAIELLASDEELRQRLGSAGRQLADTFRHQAMSRRLHELYEEILASKRGG